MYLSYWFTWGDNFNNKMRFLKYLCLLSFLSLNSCVVFFPSWFSSDEKSDEKIVRGLEIKIEDNRVLFKNKTTFEIYSLNENLPDSLILKKNVFWNSVERISLENGTYRLQSYFKYFGKNRLNTNDTIVIDNDILLLDVDIPFIVTSKETTITIERKNKKFHVEH